MTGLSASEFVEVGAGGTLVGGGGAGTWVGVGVGVSEGALSDVDVWIDVDAGVFVGSTIAGAVILSSAVFSSLLHATTDSRSTARTRIANIMTLLDGDEEDIPTLFRNSDASYWFPTIKEE